jgi:S-adenosylmethionine-dependent methyltransferase
MSSVEEFYDANTEYEWSRLDRHRVEYGLTLRAMEEHLPKPPSRIVDIGGGVGRYSIELARRGYDVTLLDLSDKALAFARDKAKEAGVSLAACIHADARDLSSIPDGTFDAALHMGPLYHLLEHAERLKSLREAHRVLRPHGAILAAFIGRYSVFQYAIARAPDFIQRRAKETESVLRAGVFQQVAPDGTFDNAWFAHPSEIAPLMTEAGFDPVDLLHCEPLVYELENQINATSAELHQQWLDLLYRFSRDPALFGGGGHLLYVGRKSA